MNWKRQRKINGSLKRNARDKERFKLVKQRKLDMRVWSLTESKQWAEIEMVNQARKIYTPGISYYK